MADPEHRVQPWQMIAGKLTEIKIDGEIFVVRRDAPPEMNPVEVARRFMRVFDTQRTTIKRKAMAASPKHAERSVAERSTTTATDGGERVGNINGISIFKNDIISFHRKFPETFQTMDLTNHMHALYPTTAIGTCTNKSRAYIKHMLRESIITRERGSKGKRIYKFVNAPYGAASPVVAEFDQDYIKNMRLLEIKTMRET